MRIIVAAFGNELRGDDGFGIAVLRRLAHQETPEPRANDVRFLEVGTGGLWLAQELLSPCDRLIIIDAMTHGAPPGTVSVLRVDDVSLPREVDMHMTVPARALGVAKAMGTLPPETFLVGCEPADTESLTWELTPLVREAVERAAQQVQSLMERA